MDDRILAEPCDLVFYIELAPLEFGDFQAVRRWMRESFGDFLFECPVPSFQFRKMRFNRHLAILLASDQPDPYPSYRKRLTLSGIEHTPFPGSRKSLCAPAAADLSAITKTR
jgi:hypothetical protein